MSCLRQRLQAMDSQQPVNVEPQPESWQLLHFRQPVSLPVRSKHDLVFRWCGSVQYFTPNNLIFKPSVFLYVHVWLAGDFLQQAPDGPLLSLSLPLLLRPQLSTTESSRSWVLLISRANTWSSSSTHWICEYLQLFCGYCVCGSVTMCLQNHIFVPQHLCVSNRDHLIQWQGQWVPWCQLWGRWCVCGLSLHPPGLDQHPTQGKFTF